MRVAFRADASLAIGTGHVMRSLALACALRARGADCYFLMRDLPGHLGTAVTAEGFELTLLRPPGPGDQADTDLAHGRWLSLAQDVDAAETASILTAAPPDWLVVDHYALDSRWEKAACPPGPRVLAIDDLADRPHAADLLLDSNLGRQTAEYDGLLPGSGVRLIGPRFALLRPQFATARPAALARRPPAMPTSVLVAMGGVDKDDATGQVLSALAGLDPPLPARVTVALGRAAPHLARVQEQASNLPFPTLVEVDVRDMAKLMTEADLAIGAAGTTSWERCCLGLPTLLLTLADNQQASAAVLDRAGAAVLVGDLHSVGWQARLRAEITRLLSESSLLAGLSARAAALVDGAGVDRTAAMLAAGRLTVRIATEADAEPIWHWRHAGNAARFYRSGRAVALADHLAWFKRALVDPDLLMLIVERDGIPAGHVRFDRKTGASNTASIGICLDLTFRGRGLAMPVMEAAQSYAFSCGLARIEAQVHAANLASRRLFEANGYSRVSQDGDFLCYVLAHPLAFA